MQNRFSYFSFLTERGFKKIKKMVLFLAVWFNLCSIFTPNFHPMYVSMTDMDIDAKSGSITLKMRMFTEDLETILHNKYNVHSWIGTPGEHQDSRRLLKEYVNERFSITVNNGEKFDLVTDSVTVIEDMMWFYMKGTAQKSIKRVEIDNRLLTDFFSSQNNLMIISVGGKEKKWDKLDRKKYHIELML